MTPCNIPTNHDHKHCINYHNSKDRKRYGNFYVTEMCPHVKAEQKCPEGDGCLYAHSFVEEHYHYLKYKKQFCSHYPVSVGECPYGDFCSYAHNEEEILTPLIHNYAENDDFYMFLYKTEFCPFNLTEHDKSKCVYAHNWQDYRRKPDHYSYEPIVCIFLFSPVSIGKPRITYTTTTVDVKSGRDAICATVGKNSNIILLITKL